MKPLRRRYATTDDHSHVRGPRRAARVEARAHRPGNEAQADQYGHLLHIAARADDGLVVISLWQSEEGSQQAWEDPEIQEARQAAERSGASTGETTFEHYQVEDYRQGS